MPKLLVALCALLTATPASADMLTLYSNGLVPNFSGYDVSQNGADHHVTDSFTVGPYTTVLEIDFMVYGFNMLASPPSVDWAITGDPFGGLVYGSGTADMADSPWYDSSFDGHAFTPLYLLSFNVNVPLAEGTYWLELSNVANWTCPGCASAFWSSSGGSSSAVSSIDGPIPSQSFQILGTVPEPASFLLMGGGLMLGAFFVRRRGRQSR